MYIYIYEEGNIFFLYIYFNLKNKAIFLIHISNHPSRIVRIVKLQDKYLWKLLSKQVQFIYYFNSTIFS